MLRLAAENRHPFCDAGGVTSYLIHTHLTSTHHMPWLSPLVLKCSTGIQVHKYLLRRFHFGTVHFMKTDRKRSTVSDKIISSNVSTKLSSSLVPLSQFRILPAQQLTKPTYNDPCMCACAPWRHHPVKVDHGVARLIIARTGWKKFDYGFEAFRFQSRLGGF